MTLSAAYGRSYKSKAAVVADFEADKDFMIESIGPDMGRYINRLQLVGAGIKDVNIRYDRMRKVCVVKVK
jgi:hypothetical protein